MKTLEQTIKSLAKDTNRKTNVEMMNVKHYAELCFYGLITYSEALKNIGVKFSDRNYI